MPTIWGENGANPVKFMLRRELNSTLGSSWNPFVRHGILKCKNFYRKNLVGHFGCVNAIEFSHDGKWLASGGDDRRVLLWNVHKAVHCTPHQPLTMQAEHASNIFAIACDRSNNKIFSGGNDDQVIVHDIHTRVPLDCFQHDQPVFGISVDPLNDSIFATACDSGRVSIYDIRDSNADPFCLTTSSSAYHAVMFNPVEPRLIVTANSKKGVALYDVRHPKKCLLKYGGNNSDQCCMSAKFSADGRRVFALRRRLPPVLYATESTNHLYQFNHMGYYNSCTMKSCSFAGENDEFVLSGSDNFDLYLWKIPSPEPPASSHKRFVQSAHLVLKGHRSIVNQVRYNPAYSVIASSGVEKLIKLFSPFPLPSPQHGQSFCELSNEKERKIYTHDDYINLIMDSGQFSTLTFDTSRRNTKEDPRMMAFFDALIQRDIEGMDEAENEPMRQRVSYTNTAFSFSSIFSDDSRSARTENGSSNEEPSEDSNISDRDSNNIQIVQSPSLISDHSSNEGDLIPINIIREEVDAHDDSSVELEVVPNESLASINHSRSEGEEEGSSHSDEEYWNNLTAVGDDGEQANQGNRERKENIITQMISKRQEQLLQMARNQVKLEIEGKQARRKRQREAKERNDEVAATAALNLSPQRTQKSPSSSSTSSSSSSDSDSSDVTDSDSKQLSDLRKKIRPLLWRNKAKILNPTSSDSSDDDVPNTNQKRRRPLKSNKSAVANKKYGASQETLTKLKLYLNSLKDNARQSQSQSDVAAVEITPSANSNEPCTSASALLRDAIAAGLSQSNVLYDENNENESSSLSSTSSSSSSSDSALERLIANEENRKLRKSVRRSGGESNDSDTMKITDPAPKLCEPYVNSTTSTNSTEAPLSLSKRKRNHPASNSSSEDSHSTSGNKSEETRKQLPIAKALNVKTKKRKTDGISNGETERLRNGNNTSLSFSLSLTTPDSGIESSINGQNGRFRSSSELPSEEINSSSSSTDYNGTEQDVEVFKQCDKNFRKRNNQHEQNREERN